MRFLFLIAVIIRAINPAYPEGVMLSILFVLNVPLKYYLEHFQNPPFIYASLNSAGGNVKAANEYLDHKEYKRRKQKGKDGVVKRMNRNAGILANQN